MIPCIGAADGKIVQQNLNYIKGLNIAAEDTSSMGPY